MPRAIITRSLNSRTSGTAPVDLYTDRVLKYIPADIIAAWIAVNGILRGTSPRPGRLSLWLIFFTGLFLCGVWTFRQVAKTDKSIALKQTLMSALAFIFWVYALGGPFPEWLGWYKPYVGSLLLIGFTVLSGVVTPSSGE